LESNSCLLSSGAPDSPVHHRTTTVHVRCTISFEIRRIRLLLLRAHWRTGHCPVHTGESGARADRWSSPRVAHRLRGRPLALATLGSPDSPVHHQTVRLIITTSPFPFPESGEFVTDDSLDSPVNYSHTTPSISETDYFTVDQPGAPDTVRCTTGQSGVPGPSRYLTVHSQVFSKFFSVFSALFLALGQTC
jgi:hypothetical protein